MYFEKPGPENTQKTLEIALDEAQKRGIKHIVVASTWGNTAKKAFELIKNTKISLIVITHNTGFSATGGSAAGGKEKSLQEFDPDIRKKLEENGIKVLTGTMVLRNLNTAIRNKFGYSQGDMIAQTLRMFCQGTKVCTEIAAMAADAGLVGAEDIICVAGTGTGADTAWIIQPNSSNNFFEIKLKEVLAKPNNF